MKFAIVIFGLEDVAEEISSKYPQADVFYGVEDLDTDYYEFIFLMSELGGGKGEKLISAIKMLNCEMIIFCATSTTFEGLVVSRTQAQEILESVTDFSGAILSGFLSFEEKVEAAELILNERLKSKHKL